MVSQSESPLRVCAVGFDARALNLLQMIFKANCRGLGILVEESEADALIIDLDAYNSSKTLAEYTERFPARAIIMLSVSDAKIPLADAIFVKKPAKIADIQGALRSIGNFRSQQQAAKKSAAADQHVHAENTVSPRTAQPEPRKLTSFVAAESGSTKSQAAGHLADENALEDIAYQADIDPQNIWEAKSGRYDPAKYLQGYLESAYKMAISRNTALCLNTGWKPIVIFPYDREVMIEADDEQLRSFCLVPVHSISSLDSAGPESNIMTIVPASARKLSQEQAAQYRTQRMEALLWKVALWTSSGRAPVDVDLTRPVYLRYWPNFTRLQVSPNALRIAALLAEQPRSLAQICEVLRIPPKDAFAFYSAARAIGLAGQAKGQTDASAAVTAPAQSRNAGVLKKILQRLFIGRREAVNG